MFSSLKFSYCTKNKACNIVIDNSGESFVVNYDDLIKGIKKSFFPSKEDIIEFLIKLDETKLYSFKKEYCNNCPVNYKNSFAWSLEYIDHLHNIKTSGKNEYPCNFQKLVEALNFICPSSRNVLKDTNKIIYKSMLDHSPFKEPIKEEMDKKNINVLPIGSSSSGNAIYVEIAGKKILIDMGISSRKISKALSAYDRKIEDIDAILVTHGHSDHINMAKTIIKNTKCKVYGNFWTLEEIKKCGCDIDRLVDVDDGEFIDGLSLIPLKLGHDFFMTYGYVLKNEEVKYTQVTDTGFVSEEVLKEMAGSDVVVLEANHDRYMLDNNKDYPASLKQRITSNHGHLSNIECGEIVFKLHEKGTRNFLLAHLSKHNNTPDIALRTVKLMLRDKWADIYVCPVEGTELLEY